MGRKGAYAYIVSFGWPGRGLEAAVEGRCGRGLRPRVVTAGTHLDRAAARSLSGPLLGSEKLLQRLLDCVQQHDRAEYVWRRGQILPRTVTTPLLSTRYTAPQLSERFLAHTAVHIVAHLSRTSCTRSLRRSLLDLAHELCFRRVRTGDHLLLFTKACFALLGAMRYYLRRLASARVLSETLRPTEKPVENAGSTDAPISHWSPACS